MRSASILVVLPTVGRAKSDSSSQTIFLSPARWPGSCSHCNVLHVHVGDVFHAYALPGNHKRPGGRHPGPLRVLPHDGLLRCAGLALHGRVDGSHDRLTAPAPSGHILGGRDGSPGLDLWETPITWIEVLNDPGTVLESAFSGWVLRDFGYACFVSFTAFTCAARCAPTHLQAESPRRSRPPPNGGKWRELTRARVQAVAHTFARPWPGSGSIYNVYSHTRGGSRFTHALLGLFPLILWTAAGVAWLVYSSGDILHHDQVAFSLAVGIEFAMLVVRVHGRCREIAPL